MPVYQNKRPNDLSPIPALEINPLPTEEQVSGKLRHFKAGTQS
jgi:hypothetical protein